MENPNRFRMHSMVGSWAAQKRLNDRITQDEWALWSELWALHVGPETPTPKHYLVLQHWMSDESVTSRLKPVSGPKDDA
jgi:hypothetical protein